MDCQPIGCSPLDLGQDHGYVPEQATRQGYYEAASSSLDKTMPVLQSSMELWDDPERGYHDMLRTNAEPSFQTNEICPGAYATEIRQQECHQNQQLNAWPSCQKSIHDSSMDYPEVLMQDRFINPDPDLWPSVQVQVDDITSQRDEPMQEYHESLVPSLVPSWEMAVPSLQSNMGLAQQMIQTLESSSNPPQPGDPSSWHLKQFLSADTLKEQDMLQTFGIFLTSLESCDDFADLAWLSHCACTTPDPNKDLSVNKLEVVREAIERGVTAHLARERVRLNGGLLSEWVGKSMPDAIDLPRTLRGCARAIVQPGVAVRPCVKEDRYDLMTMLIDSCEEVITPIGREVGRVYRARNGGREVESVSRLVIDKFKDWVMEAIDVLRGVNGQGDIVSGGTA